jgi:hypothetical protein
MATTQAAAFHFLVGSRLQNPATRKTTVPAVIHLTIPGFLLRVLLALLRLSDSFPRRFLPPLPPLLLQPNPSLKFEVRLVAYPISILSFSLITSDLFFVISFVR